MRKYLLISIALLGFVFSTNKWMDWTDAAEYLKATDVLTSYEPMAMAAPKLLNFTPELPMPFHKAQRFLVPYLFGSCAKIFSISHRSVFQWSNLLVIFLITLFFLRLGSKLRLNLATLTLCLATYVLNVYAIRYYLLIPGSVCDPLFTLGTLLIIIGLVEVKTSMIFLGALLSITARQTAILLLPGIAFWMYFSPEWKKKSLTSRMFYFVSSSILIALVYLWTGKIAHKFAGPSLNLSIITEIIRWTNSPEFSVQAFAELATRTLIPYFSVIGIGAATKLQDKEKRKLNAEVLALFLMSACISVQPILAGPIITGGNASRLGSLGLLPAVVAVMFLCKKTNSENKIILSKTALLSLMPCLLSLMLSSFHHMYTVVGPSSAAQFALLQVFFAFTTALSAAIFFKATSKEYPLRTL